MRDTMMVDDPAQHEPPSSYQLPTYPQQVPRTQEVGELQFTRIDTNTTGLANDNLDDCS